MCNPANKAATGVSRTCTDSGDPTENAREHRSASGGDQGEGEGARSAMTTTFRTLFVTSLNVAPPPIFPAPRPRRMTPPPPLISRARRSAAPMDGRTTTYLRAENGAGEVCVRARKKISSRSVWKKASGVEGGGGRLTFTLSLSSSTSLMDSLMSSS